MYRFEKTYKTPSYAKQQILTKDHSRMRIDPSRSRELFLWSNKISEATKYVYPVRCNRNIINSESSSDASRALGK